jgi:hypothetical protein
MKTILNSLALIVTIFSICSCNTAERLLQKGRYDELLSLAERKMIGKRTPKEKHVLLAEEAFRKVTDRDMDRIERLKASDRSEDWEEISEIALRIEKRQDRLKPFLPMVADNGYEASFTFVKAEEILRYAEDQIIERLYEEGFSYLEEGRDGDKAYAKAAYEKFQDLISYKAYYRDVVKLRDEARQLGITRVLIKVDNEARSYMPRYVAEELEQSLGAQGSFWTQYYTQPAEGLALDYEARLVVHSMDVGPEVIREEEIKRQKDLQDGWTYVLDANGNVAKDTAGNDIKTPRFITVRAVVLKTHQEKGVQLRGRIELEDLRTGTIVESKPVAVESRFYHMAQSFHGDERALEGDDRKFIGLVPFPDNESMMLEVAELVHPAFSRELQQSRYL